MARHKPGGAHLRDLLLLTVLAVSLASNATAAELPKPSEAEIRAAVERAIPLLQKAAASSLKQRSCFMCHHTATTVFAVEAARRRGLTIDSDNLEAQIQRAYGHVLTSARSSFDAMGAPDSRRLGRQNGSPHAGLVDEVSFAGRTVKRRCGDYLRCIVHRGMTFAMSGAKVR